MLVADVVEGMLERHASCVSINNNNNNNINNNKKIKMIIIIRII